MCLLNVSMQLMMTASASPDDPSEVSLTTSLQPASQITADYNEQSMSVFVVEVVVVIISGLKQS